MGCGFPAFALAWVFGFESSRQEGEFPEKLHNPVGWSCRGERIRLVVFSGNQVTLGKREGNRVFGCLPSSFRSLPFCSLLHPKDVEKGESNASTQKTLFDHLVQRSHWWSPVLLQPDSQRAAALLLIWCFRDPSLGEKMKEKNSGLFSEAIRRSRSTWFCWVQYGDKFRTMNKYEKYFYLQGELHVKKRMFIMLMFIRLSPVAS